MQFETCINNTYECMCIFLKRVIIELRFADTFVHACLSELVIIRGTYLNSFSLCV